MSAPYSAPVPSTPSGQGGRDAESLITPLVIGLPVAAASLVLLVWAGTEGGYSRTVWYAGALFLLGLLAVLVAVGRPLATRVTRLRAAAVGLLTLFVAWTFASLTWANVPGEAWDGANRALLYLILFCIFALWSGSAGTATFVLAFVSFGICALGLVSLVAAAEAESPSTYFSQGRFVEPLGYHNGDAALFLIAFMPALVLSSRRNSPALLRATALAAAAVLLALSVLPQSRASIVALPLTLLVVLAVVPDRIRVLVSTAVVGLAVLLIRDPLLDVYRGVDEAALRESLGDARTAVLGVAIVCFLVGLGLSAAESRLPVRRVERRTGASRRTAAVAALAVTAVVAVLAVLAVTTGRAADFWDKLSSGQPTEKGASHFSSGLGSNRPDMWRVAWEEFADHPLHGIGADNFAVAYVRERRSTEEPRYPHSVELQLLSQFGLIGTALFVGFLACAVSASLGRSARSADERMLAAAALGGFTYWLVHGSVDWFWEIPALGGTAFALLGLAVGLGPGTRSIGRPAGVARPIAAGGLAIVFVVAAASLLGPWAAARQERFASGEWRRDPEAAFASLERARSLNPLSERPDLLAGAIASRREDWPEMRRYFRRALERNHFNWYAELELAVAEALEGRPMVAREHLARAARLNRREPAVELVRRSLDGEGTLDPAELDQLFRSRLRERER